VEEYRAPRYVRDVNPRAGGNWATSVLAGAGAHRLSAERSKHLGGECAQDLTRGKGGAYVS
jgi:hypothetical protein